MKKKIIIAVMLFFIAVGCSITYATLRAGNRKEPINASRRDGEIVDSSVVGDEDLEAVSGESASLINNVKDTESANERAGSDSSLFASIESIEATKPTTENVESVSVILLPEAVRIGNGSAGDFYSDEDYIDVIPVDIGSFGADEIPEKYDSRDVDGNRYVTTVEDQGYSYLCWTYAALGAVESDILMHNPDISYKDLDFSEKHLAYYNMHEAKGSYGGYIDDDFRELVNADEEENAWIFDYDTNYIAMGGVTNYCISLLTAWKGPVTEEGKDAFKSIYGAKYLFSDNSDKPSEPYLSEVHIKHVNEIPSDYDNNSMIKQLIMEHGSVSAGVDADEEFWGRKHKNLYASFSGKEAEGANHEILIIGWDDGYSAQNFVKAPPGDGAWLCRNSWGEGTGEGGYFYLSFYDETLALNNVAAYGTSLPETDEWYDNNYQAAGYLTYVVSGLVDSENYVTAYSESSNPYGVMYEAVEDEKLKAIGFMGLETYQQYEISIYVNPKKDDEVLPFSMLKEPQLKQKVSAISGGYHTFVLDKEITLRKGDEFFILINPKTKGRLAFENQVDNTSKPNYDEWNNLTGNVHNNYSASGCSYYVLEDGTGLIRQNDKDFFVKAYTNLD